MMVQRVFLSILGALFIISCAKDNNGGGFGKPSPPVLSPTEGTFDYTDDNNLPYLTITSQDDVRYTASLSGAPTDPDCSFIDSSNKEYTGPFQIGGPDETVRVKAVACDGGVSSVVTSSGQYVFGP